MDPHTTRPPTEPPDGQGEPPPRPRISRRASIIGTLVALLLVAGVGWLAWELTHPPAPDPAATSPSAGGAAGGRPGGARSGGGGAGGGGGGAGGPGGGRGGPASTVGVATAERIDIPVVLEALGTVVPQATVRVRPQVSGVLQQVLFKEGQTVRKGELLATIDPRQFELALQQAVGQRMQGDAQIEAARVTLQRFRTLLQQDSIARQEVDTQAALVKQLEAAVVIAKANEGTARLNLGYTRIVAPIAGRVGLRTVDVGNVVGTTDVNGVALITQVSPIDVEFAVPQDQAAALQQGGRGAMEVKALDRTRSTVLDTGVFSSLDNQVDTQTGTVRAKARFANAALAMFPSQFVNVRLQLRTIEGAVAVPVAALRSGAGGDHVFVVKEDRTVALRPVTRGQATVDKVQIANGLQVGERVITEGADRLRDGSRVVLPGDAPGGRRQGGASAPRADSVAPRPDSASPRSDAVSPRTEPAPLPPGASAAGSNAAPPARAPRTEAPAVPTVPAVSTAAAAPAVSAARPSDEQRRRMLDSAQGDPEQLARRKKFLEAIDRGEPAALERWQQMQQRRRDGGGGPTTTP